MSDCSCALARAMPGRRGSARGTRCFHIELLPAVDRGRGSMNTRGAGNSGSIAHLGSAKPCARRKRSHQLVIGKKGDGVDARGATGTISTIGRTADARNAAFVPPGRVLCRATDVHRLEAERPSRRPDPRNRRARARSLRGRAVFGDRQFDEQIVTAPEILRIKLGKARIVGLHPGLKDGLEGGTSWHASSID